MVYWFIRKTGISNLSLGTLKIGDFGSMSITGFG